MRISCVSWTVSIETELRGWRGIPSWNLSLVLHQLTKSPFEPIKEASLKHLIFKTVFLLALGLGKHRSEIHVWQNKNIRHQSDWSKSSFLSKNQLAKEGLDSVAPVVIPPLAPTLNKAEQGVSLFDKDISPATISSWIKKTVVLCYELSDQEAFSLHQVKPMISGPLLLLRPSSRESP